MDIEKYVEELAQGASCPGPVVQSGQPHENLDRALKGHAVELWSTATGRLFLVADEADALQAIERFGTRRGEVYTAMEARRIIAVNDAVVVAEIHDWKRRFDGVVREFQGGGRPK